MGGKPAGQEMCIRDRHRTWIVWPVAGVLFAVVMCLCDLLERRKD